MTILSKSDIENLIKIRDPSISYAKPKKSNSEHWVNISQVFVNHIAQNFICCSTCGKLISWKTGNGSSNLKKHTQYCHNAGLHTQRLITTFILNSNENNERLARIIKKKIITAAAEFCAVDNRSFAIVHGDGFKLLAHAFYDAGHSLNNLTPVESILPDRTSISREIDKLFAEDHAKLVKLLSSINRYCVTIDFWSESYTKFGYSGASIHYFDDKSGLNTFILSCMAYDLHNQHAENVRYFTENILHSYGLEIYENIFITSDNEPKMRAAFRYGIIRVGCSAHYLNKVIEHALTLRTIGCDNIQQMFNNVQEVVNHIRRSHTHSKLSKRLQIFSKTRWNSAYWMVQSFINVYSELHDIIKDSDEKEKFNAIDYNLLLEFAKYLKYFVDVTEALSADKTPTIHLVVPLRQRLINLSTPNTSESSVLFALKKYIFHEIPSYWKIQDIHLMNVVLHPNFKHLQICPSIKLHSISIVNFESSSEATSFYGSTTTSQQTTSQDDGDIISVCFDHEQPKKKKNINSEFDRYLNDETKLMRSENVLDFWSKYRHVFPVLFSIAKDILIIPATNTCVERLFSASGNAVTNARTRLNHNKINKLMFLKKNHLVLESITKTPTSKTNSNTKELESVGNTEELFNEDKNDHFQDEEDDDDDHY